MPTYTIEVSDADMERLRQLASAKGVNAEALMEDLLKQAIAGRLLPKSVGMGDSGIPKRSARVFAAGRSGRSTTSEEASDLRFDTKSWLS